MTFVPRLWLVALICFLGGAAFAGRWFVSERRAEIRAETESAMSAASALLRMRAEAARPSSMLAWREGLEILRDSRHLTATVSSPGRFAAVPEPGNLSVPGVPGWFVALVLPPRLELERRLPIGSEGDEIILRARPDAEVLSAWRELRSTLVAGVTVLVSALLWMSMDLRAGLARFGDLARAIDGFSAGRHETRSAASGRPEIDRVVESFNRLADRIARSEAELSEVAQRSLAIREDERRHLAHELHDGIGQSISAIKALAVSIARKAKPDSGIAPSAMMIADVSSSMYDQVRQMMDRLRPSILDELGLISAIGSMIDDWNTHHEQTFCGFEHSGQIPDLPADVSINIFRIVQEALTNVVKHAQAGSVMVRLSVGGAQDGLRLEIEDDGRGFDAAAARRGLGLVGIEERVRAVGGALHLAAAPGRGTRFEIHIPLIRKEPYEHVQHEAENPAG